ncbi:hypothetical protein ACJX0J_016405, partial [Zea mays]
LRAVVPQKLTSLSAFERAQLLNFEIRGYSSTTIHHHQEWNLQHKICKKFDKEINISSFYIIISITLMCLIHDPEAKGMLEIFLHPFRPGTSHGSMIILIQVIHLGLNPLCFRMSIITLCSGLVIGPIYTSHANSVMNPSGPRDLFEGRILIIPSISCLQSDFHHQDSILALNCATNFMLGRFMCHSLMAFLSAVGGSRSELYEQNCFVTIEMLLDGQATFILTWEPASLINLR